MMIMLTINKRFNFLNYLNYRNNQYKFNKSTLDHRFVLTVALRNLNIVCVTLVICNQYRQI